ncbi:hypothetical protein ACFMQL_05575 [Nonomuraea fastidiosa]|jgi:hypothetical protein|uniref:hypothetical protein n=1 Tax=Nonomuraea TaxID=83681 RepID=UPI00324F4C13
MTVTPAQLRALANRAEALAAEVRALCAHPSPVTTPDAGASPGADPLAAARQAADWLARSTDDLRRAATELARLQVEPCGLAWAVCPEHGNTLSSMAGVSKCRVCGWSRSTPRPGQPCGAPVTWKVIDRSGGETRMCDGHVLGARAVSQGATFIRIDQALT